jgi:hypothetical protein
VFSVMADVIPVLRSITRRYIRFRLFSGNLNSLKSILANWPSCHSIEKHRPTCMALEALVLDGYVCFKYADEIHCSMVINGARSSATACVLGFLDKVGKMPEYPFL